LLGWWSLPGLLFTPAAIVNNLYGGIDVTSTLVGSLPGLPVDDSMKEEYEAAVNRERWVIVLVFVLFLVGLALFAAIF